METKQEIQVLDPIQAIRKRPGMYVGNLYQKGTMRIFTMLIEDCAFLCQTDDFFIEIAILETNKFSVMIQISTENQRFAKWITLFVKNYLIVLSPEILVALTSFLFVKTANEALLFENTVLKKQDEIAKNDILTQINFEFILDKTIFEDTNIDYFDFSNELLTIAMKNRNIKILLKDFRQTHLNQSYYHFPQGIFYHFDKVQQKYFHKPSFVIRNEGVLQNWAYQIGIAYGYNEPEITFFTLDNQLQEILLTAIIDGLALACKRYIKKQALSDYKIARKGFYDGLILVCNPRENIYKSRHSFEKSILDKKDIKGVVADFVYQHLLQNETETLSFLARFHKKLQTISENEANCL